MILQLNHKEFLNFAKNNRSERSESCLSQSTDDELDVKIYPYNKKAQIKHFPQTSKFRPTQKKSKYKTQMCKNYSEMGYCPYKNKCQYAHGYNQFLSNEFTRPSKSYRTKKCKSFWENGVCFYGIRCQFAHYEVKDDTKLFLKVCYQAQVMNKIQIINRDYKKFVVLNSIVITQKTVRMVVYRIKINICEVKQYSALLNLDLQVLQQNKCLNIFICIVINQNRNKKLLLWYQLLKFFKIIGNKQNLILNSNQVISLNLLNKKIDKIIYKAQLESI